LNFPPSGLRCEQDHRCSLVWGVGVIALPDIIVASASEGWLGQDRSNRISIIDERTGGLLAQIQVP